MANICLARVQREIQAFLKNPESGVKLELKGESLTELRGEITGPSETPYEGGTFVLDITIPENYPIGPPVIKYATKVWHPNISSVTGAICVDFLKNKWAAALTLRAILVSLQALLSAAVPDDPQDAIVAKQFMNSPQIFNQTARHWTNVFAGGSNKEPDLEQKIEELKVMGFEENQARIALSNHNWVIDGALSSLS